MGRRLGGALLLALALLAALLVPRVLHPRGVDGRAAVAAAPSPLVTGDCLARSTAGYTVSAAGELRPSDPVELVPCARPHAGETVRVELSLPPATGEDPTEPAEQFMSRCWSDLTSLWNPSAGPGDWTPQLRLTLGIVGPDRRQLAAGQHWVACVAGPEQGTLDRPLAAFSDDAGPPAEFGLCSRWQPESDVAVTVDCAEPHTVEQFGRRVLERGSPLDQSTLASSCAALAAAVTRRPGLPDDPSLAVDTAVTARYDSGDTSPVLAPLPVDAVAGEVSCSVRVTDDRRLTASLRQIGDAPLPWAT